MTYYRHELRYGLNSYLVHPSTNTCRRTGIEKFMLYSRTNYPPIHSSQSTESYLRVNLPS
jgi:hypothetical protein